MGHGKNCYNKLLLALTVKYNIQDIRNKHFHKPEIYYVHSRAIKGLLGKMGTLLPDQATIIPYNKLAYKRCIQSSKNRPLIQISHSKLLSKRATFEFVKISKGQRRLLMYIKYK